MVTINSDGSLPTYLDANDRDRPKLDPTAVAELTFTLAEVWDGNAYVLVSDYA